MKYQSFFISMGNYYPSAASRKQTNQVKTILILFTCISDTFCVRCAWVLYFYFLHCGEFLMS